jgi:ribonuclease P protein component
MSKREGFPHRRRIRRRPDFLQIQGGGKRFSTPHFLVFALHRPIEGADKSRLVSTARFGITVSRKVGCAVTRNRIKRWVRECCRREAFCVGPSWDVVVVAKPQACEALWSETKAELAGVWLRLGGAPQAGLRAPRLPSGRGS